MGGEGGPSLYTASSSDYLTTSHLHSRPFSALNRVTRALSNSTLGAVGGSGLVGRLQKVFGRARTTRTRQGKRHHAQQPTTLTLQQLMALHAQLSVVSVLVSCFLMYSFEISLPLHFSLYPSTP